MKIIIFSILIVSIVIPELSLAREVNDTDCELVRDFTKAIFKAKKDGIDPEGICNMAKRDFPKSSLNSSSCNDMNAVMDNIISQSSWLKPDEIALMTYTNCKNNHSKDKKSANKSDAEKMEAWSILKNLKKRMYSIGERTGSFNDWRKAETEAAEDIFSLAEYNPESLVFSDEFGETPLMFASRYGYDLVVESFLENVIVRKNIDAKDNFGTTAINHVTFIKGRTSWMCGPYLSNNTFELVPGYVTKPYYERRKVSPYETIFEMLKNAGAKYDDEITKNIWIKICANSGPETIDNLRDTRNLLKEILNLGNETFKVFDQKQNNNNK